MRYCSARRCAISALWFDLPLTNKGPVACVVTRRFRDYLFDLVRILHFESLKQRMAEARLLSEFGL